ncbi:DUF4915 domain-containing protein [Nostoc sp.]|uniref:DUF4915 domain-containing protein n=1 Tax=Nostoc sp. TaxID=1180 RepID=UPI002FF7F9BA
MIYSEQITIPHTDDIACGHKTNNYDLMVEADNDRFANARGDRILFISTILNCVATVSDRHSCIPLWKPKFISSLVNEDRCHLS